VRLRSQRKEVPARPKDIEADFWPLYERCKPFTMTSEERMYALWQTCMYVTAAGVPGDFVECGVWKGGSSMLAALSLPDRRLWLYDTFEGMPDPSDHDVDLDGRSMSADWESYQRDPVIRADSPLEEVRRNLGATGHTDVRLVRGLVEDTIPADAPDHIAILRLDTDWYESTRHELEHLWPRLAAGGVLIVDDYGHWQGARQAVDEYFGGRVLLQRIDYTGRLAIKP
jgi:O-methyltransferase